MLQSILFNLLSILIAIGGEDIQETYTVDSAASKIEWSGKKVTGEHNGTILLKEGSFVFENKKLIGGSFVIDMTSIINKDLEGQWRQKLEGHLKSDDFFGVAQYPTANLVITQAVPQGPGKYKILGDMTIKGKTNQIKFNAVFNQTEDKVIGTSTIVIDRSNYDVKYGSGSFFDDLGDKTIYDDFELKVKVVANK
ncbi:MAG: YceI family protein [Cyclobacteriaceae bacterium]